jgi:hypothetical protein
MVFSLVLLDVLLQQAALVHHVTHQTAGGFKLPRLRKVSDGASRGVPAQKRESVAVDWVSACDFVAEDFENVIDSLAAARSALEPPALLRGDGPQLAVDPVHFSVLGQLPGRRRIAPQVHPSPCRGEGTCARISNLLVCSRR